MVPWGKGRPADMAMAGPGTPPEVAALLVFLGGRPRSAPSLQNPDPLLPAQVLTNSLSSAYPEELQLGWGGSGWGEGSL